MYRCFSLISVLTAKMNRNGAAISLLQEFGAEDCTPVAHHAHQTVNIRNGQSHHRMKTNSSNDDSNEVTVVRPLDSRGIESTNTNYLYANELSFEDGSIRRKSNKQLKHQTKKIISGVTNLIAGLNK